MVKIKLRLLNVFNVASDVAQDLPNYRENCHDEERCGWIRRAKRRAYIEQMGQVQSQWARDLIKEGRVFL